MGHYSYDVVIVGASIAGCTAATLLGRAGLRVALIEKQKSKEAYKKLCTHFIQASAVPTMDRLGISEQIEAAGGLRTGSTIWIPYGDHWLKPYAEDGRYPHYGYNIRREKLDIIVREVAMMTKGVDFFFGHSAKDLLEENGKFTAVITAEQATKQTHLFNGRLIVAADGHYSKLAELSQAKTKRWKNGRFGYFAYYKNMPLKRKNLAQIWFLDPDAAYAFPCDNGVTLLAVMPTIDQLPAFKQNIEGNLIRRMKALPEGPDMARGERISPIYGMLKGEFHYRQPTLPGLAFMGDAAASTDPLWGCGGGWAFQSAEWLADCTREALVTNQGLENALKQYEQTHKQKLRGHNLYNATFGNGRKFWPHERITFAAATKNKSCAQHIHQYASRHTSVGRLYSPVNFVRSVWVNAFG